MMYQALIFIHSLMRWLVLLSLLYAIFRAGRGLACRTAFTRADNAVRHGTATIAHIQLMIGMVLYFRSPVIQYFYAHRREALQSTDASFFAMIHPLLMLAAILLITLGSALAKRRTTDPGRFRTMLLWFSAGLLLILLAIPWPGSPLASRPYFR